MEDAKKAQEFMHKWSQDNNKNIMLIQDCEQDIFECMVAYRNEAELVPVYVEVECNRFWPSMSATTIATKCRNCGKEEIEH